MVAAFLSQVLTARLLQVESLAALPAVDRSRQLQMPPFRHSRLQTPTSRLFSRLWECWLTGFERRYESGTEKSWTKFYRRLMRLLVPLVGGMLFVEEVKESNVLCDVSSHLRWCALKRVWFRYRPRYPLQRLCWNNTLEQLICIYSVRVKIIIRRGPQTPNTGACHYVCVADEWRQVHRECV